METAPLLTPERVLRRIEWKVVRRLDGRLQGEFRTLLRGSGTDFLDLRDYQWGDDVRHIDWNVTARMDELFVRDFMEDRELTAWLLLDRSRSMTFGTVERTKEQVLCELAGCDLPAPRAGRQPGRCHRSPTACMSGASHRAKAGTRCSRSCANFSGRSSGGQLTDLGKLLETAARDSCVAGRSWC